MFDNIPPIVRLYIAAAVVGFLIWHFGGVEILLNAVPIVGPALVTVYRSFSRISAIII